MDWVFAVFLTALIFFVFSFRYSLPFLDRICRAPLNKQFPSVGISEEKGETNAPL